MRTPALLTSAFGLLFLILVALMQFDPDEFVRIDTMATGLVHLNQNWTIASFFISVTDLGNTISIIFIALGVAFFIRKERAMLLRLFVLLIGVAVSIEVIKPLISRVRPEALPWIGPLHSYSFPSGHAASSMALFGFIAIIAYRRAPTRLLRLLSIAVPVALIFGIGLSRVVLSAHYASDVFAGYLLGAFWLSFVFFLPMPRFVRVDDTVH